MAVYCEPRTDAEIFDEIGGAKHILLVGCPFCANVSYSIQKDLPLYEFTSAGLQAVGTGDEIHRLAELFAQRGLDVDSWLPGFPASLCMLGEEARKNLFDKCEHIDAVVTLCCETGTKNVGDIARGKRVVGGMNARGLLAGVTKAQAGKMVFDKRTLYIKRFVFQ